MRTDQAYLSRFLRYSFTAAVADQVGQLELKGRVRIIADALYRFLPADYLEALNILLNILGPENKTEEGIFTSTRMSICLGSFDMEYDL